MSDFDICLVDMERINRMDTSAFRLLYKVFYKALVDYAYRYTNDMNAAEDIVQDVFVALWERKRSFLSPRSVKAFFYNSVHNASLNWLKHKNVVSGYAQQASQGLARDPAPTDDDFFDEEIYRQLFAAIDALPPQQREVFLLQMVGKKNAEIAEVLNMTINTVKTHKRRGLAYLRKHVSHECLILLSTMVGNMPSTV